MTICLFHNTSYQIFQQSIFQGDQWCSVCCLAATDEKVYIKTYKIVHYDRPDRYYEIDYTKDFETHFRPLQLIEDYNPQYNDPEYGKDPYWDDELYDKENLQFQHDDYPQRMMRTTLRFLIANYPGPS